MGGGGSILDFIPSRRSLLLGLSLLALLLLIACSKEKAPSLTAKATAVAQTGTVGSSPEDPPPTSNTLTLPANFERRTGDLDEMVKIRRIRALVLLNPIGFFYQNGHPKGVICESLQEFQKFTNKKLKTGKAGLQVIFIPVRADQVEGYLTEGLGDLIAHGVTITPDREKRVAFSLPLLNDATQIIVTGPEYAAISTLEGLGGKKVHVNPVTVYFENLQKVNDSLQKAGKATIAIEAADRNLGDDDLIQMVGAGLIPATVTTKQRAALWSQVLPNLKPHPELVIASNQQLAWVMRKNNPQLKQLVDEFVKGHAAGTSFGNTLLRRYLATTKWVKNSTSNEEMQKYAALGKLFQKYAAEYDFDTLMVAAQAYQESELNQSARNPSGAVGVMQVIPKYAAAKPINISDVANADGNVHAEVKMLRNIADTYFNDPKLDPMNRTLFVFASYNAGPNRIQKLRTKAAATGLDPNTWFGNVELVAAKDIGQETVLYVGNIYKYYIAYRLAQEQGKLQGK